MSAADRWDREYPSYAEFYEHAYGPHIASVRTVGSVGATRLEAHQSAGDWSDAPTPELALAWVTSQPVKFTVDLGAGRFSGKQRAGDAVLIAPGSGASIQMDAPHVCRVISIPYAGLLSQADGADALPPDGDFGPLHAGLLRDRELLRVLDALWRVTEASRTERTLLVDGLILQTVGHLLGLRDRGLELARRERASASLSRTQLRRAVDLIDERLDGQLTIPLLAGAAGVSPFHFARCFKAGVGEAPHAYVMRRRVERAKDMLMSTDESVTAIALACGFASSQHLATVFRRAVGLSPIAYRRERG